MTRTTGQAVIAVGLGGAVGTTLRVGVSELIGGDAGGWPWATLAVNLAGAWLLAFIGTRLLISGATGGWLLPLVGTGFCGALTTFSTFQIEIITIWRETGPPVATAYALINVVAGLAIVWWVARRLEAER
ncbi:MAG: CrcB family protein [Thermoleophilia bacterium]